MMPFLLPGRDLRAPRRLKSKLSESEQPVAGLPGAAASIRALREHNFLHDGHLSTQPNLERNGLIPGGQL